MKKKDKSPQVKMPNFIPWNRDWKVIKKHAPLILKSAFSALIFVMIWICILYPLDIHFDKKNNDDIRFLIYPFAILSYVFFAGIAVGSVLKEYKILSRAVTANKKDEFLIHRDEQLPIKIHIFVATPSLIIIFYLMLYDYEGSRVFASSVIFCVTFLLILSWNIANEIDDFKKSTWFQERVLKEWYETDVHEHFYKKEEKK